jgi:hypothetical protein
MGEDLNKKIDAKANKSVTWWVIAVAVTAIGAFVWAIIERFLQ